MIRKGEPWGSDASGPPDLEISGDDAELARSVVLAGTVPLVGYRPSPGADLARSVGLTPDSPRLAELTIDALDVGVGGADHQPAMNAVVLGTAPDRLSRWTRSRSFEVTIDGRPTWTGRATGVVVANGQFLRGFDVVPRGHPGDGRLEIQVYSPAAGERAEMRRRLATGTHVPHPRILERSGRVIEVAASSAVAIEVDGAPKGSGRRVRVAVLPGALRILV
jgi:hypothetical protein